MPPRALAISGITFRSFSTARPTAKRGVQGQLSALSRLKDQPNMARASQTILTRIAKVKLFFPFPC